MEKVSVQSSENYNFRAIEQKWQKIWEERETFEFLPHGNEKKYYVLEMFPYPSGELHAGHLRNYSVGDVIARFRTMQGYNVLHPMGADAFGLPAENAAIKNGAHPLGWTEKNIDSFLNSMKKLGLSYDFSRFFATCFPEYYGKQQEIFLTMYEKGLIYRKESFVNWDPIDKTVLANEQVIDGKGWRSGAVVEKKKLNQWFFNITRYSEELLRDIDEKLQDWPERVKLIQKNWIGKSEGALIDFEVAEDSVKLTVYTTRPDTIFGASFVGISPDHSLAEKLAVDNVEIRQFLDECQKTAVNEETIATMEKKGIFTGFHVKHPFDNDVKLPIYIANFILMDYGTGAIFGCPAHDERDFDFAVKYGLPIKKVVSDKEKHDDFIQKNIYRLHCQNPYFDYIKKGVKTIEGRKNSPKYQIYRVGDVINFYNDSDNFFAEITKISKYQNLREYLEKNDLSNILPNVKTIEEGEKIYRGFADDLDKYEFLGLHLKLLAKKELLNVEEGITFNSDFLNGMPTKEAKVRALDKIEEMKIGTRKVNYRLRDWGFSRQRYWGCPIPVVYCPKCGVVCLSREDLPLKLPEDVVFDGKGNPLDNHPTWKHVKCPKCGSDATRETDTMDTFVDSSWYFLRFVDLCDDKTINKELCDEVMPIDQYIGGIEHATGHLMYARFFTKAMRDCGYLNIDEPVKKLFNQGLLCHNAYRGKITKDWCYPKDLKKENGKFYNTTTGEELSYEGNIKMSKSKSNVIGIDGVAANYGTDSARLFLLSDTPADKDMEWSDEGINGCWRYINKIYKVIVNFRNKYDVKYDNPNNYVNDTIRYTHKVIKDVTENFEKIEFNKAIARIRELSNFFEKTTLDTQENIESYAFAIANYLKLLNPFTPHFCSEMLEILSIKDITWPSFDENLTVDDVVVIAIQVNGKLRETIEVVKDLSNGEIEARAKVEKSVVKYLDGHEIKRVVVVPNKLVNFVL